MKCRWSHCKHGGEVNKDDAVKDGSAYYHADCYAEKKAIQDIIDLYHEKVDANPIENYLRKTVNDLIFKDGNAAEYLLFAFRYCLNNGWHLHTPSGLRYVAKDGTAKDAWNKKITRPVTVDFPTIKDDGGTSFTYKPQKQTSFSDILG